MFGLVVKQSPLDNNVEERMVEENQQREQRNIEKDDELSVC